MNREGDMEADAAEGVLKREKPLPEEAVAGPAEVGGAVDDP